MMTGRAPTAWRLPWGHLSDRRLLAVAIPDTDLPAPAGTLRHVSTCPRCEARLALLAADLDAIRATATGGFDAVYTPARLQAQRARIGHRLATMVGAEPPARVITFPFSERRPLPSFHPGLGRWIGAATAAGLVLGAAVGQVLDFSPVPVLPAPTAIASDGADLGPRSVDMTGTVELPPLGTGNLPPDPAAAAPITLSEFEQIVADEAFLTSLDLALTHYSVDELELIDALTPRVGDFIVDIQ